MIELRACETDADFEAWIGVRRAVLPNERAPSLDELKAIVGPNDLHLIAELDGQVAGSGVSNRSDISGRAFLAPRVLPTKRRRGVGSALLKQLTDHAGERGFTLAGTWVSGDDEGSIAFAKRFGFEEWRRDIQQVLELNGTPREPRNLAGVEFVSIAARPELLRDAYYRVAQQGYADMPIEGLDIRVESWVAEEATLPGGSFVALADGEIVGFAGLMNWPDDPTKAEHGLTVVRRDWRRRGLASAMKEREIAWAAANGIRCLVTYTQTGNENMRAVNARLGYVITATSINFTRSLPLP